MQGTSLGDSVAVEDHCIIEENVRVGPRSRIIYHALICNDSRIGSDCVIGGFVGERSVVGNHCRIFGSLVHRQDDPAIGWDENEEAAPVLGHHILVGFGAVIIGDVEIGDRTVIGAGAIVTKSVPPNSAVVGNRRPIPLAKSRLKIASSDWFRSGNE
jgi:serine acetyltransferase